MKKWSKKLNSSNNDSFYYLNQCNLKKNDKNNTDSLVIIMFILNRLTELNGKVESQEQLLMEAATERITRSQALRHEVENLSKQFKEDLDF